jgi:hypothetical protein
MQNQINTAELFSQYYARWIKVYKEGAIRNVTMQKYRMTHTDLQLKTFHTLPRYGIIFRD